MDHDRLADQLYPEAGHIPGNYDAIMEQYDREKAQEHGVEAAAFAAIMEADYTEARLIIKAMDPKDRAVLAFWADELAGVIMAVQTGEERY